MDANDYWQSFWRGEQGWTRTVPIVNGQVSWEAASNWSTTQSIAFWRGGDREGGRRRSVNAGAGPREHAATTASENTTVVATPGDGTTKYYYYLGGQRVAMSQNGMVYYPSTALRSAQDRPARRPPGQHERGERRGHQQADVLCVRAAAHERGDAADGLHIYGATAGRQRRIALLWGAVL
ncbi:MAG TPA: hypothetical protein VF932_06295 [Anaerolineae bacterium]